MVEVEVKEKLLVSQRAQEMGTENAFSVGKEVEELERNGKKILKFHIGQPDFYTPEYINKAAIKAIEEKEISKYTGSAGKLKLRTLVAEFLEKTRQIKVSPESIVISAGGKPFIEYSVLCTTDYGKGDEVIYPVPGYPIYESQARLHGCKAIPLYLREEKGFNFDIEELREKVNDKTRLLILNSPHNPTGGVLSKKELKEISDIVLEQDNLWVYSDEVYSKMVYGEEFHSIASVCEEMQERTIMVDCVSKTFAMPGWRIGYASNEKLAEYFANCVTNTISCAPHISQEAVIEALLGSQESSKEMYNKFKERSKLITEELNKIDGVKCLLPGGAFYVWPNVTELCEMTGITDYCNKKILEENLPENQTKYLPSEKLRQILLYEVGVAVLADIHFGPKVPGEGEHIRLSYAASSEDIIKGVEKIKYWAEKNS